jgi:hypothetical protein
VTDRRTHDIDEPESPHERLNREFDQLLGGLRVALPGVQVLFAFLLTVAFSDAFSRMDHDADTAYLLAVTLAASASVLLIAPSVHHRLRFRDGTKEQMIRTANTLTLAGSVCLGLAIGCAVYLVGDVGFPGSPARWIGVGITVLAVLTWFVLPLGYRADRTPRPGQAGPEG